MLQIPDTFELVQSGDLTVDQAIVAEPWRTMIRSQAYMWSRRTCQAGGLVFDGAVVDSTSLTQASASGGDLVGHRPIVWPRRYMQSDRTGYELTAAIYTTGTDGTLSYQLDKMDPSVQGSSGIVQTLASGSVSLTQGDWTLITVGALVSDYGDASDRPPAVISYEWSGDMTVYQLQTYGTPITDAGKLPTN